jgi:hypothetical protein
MADITLSERVYVDEDGRATTDEARGARLWGTPGLVVSEADAAAIGYGVKADPEPVAKMVRKAPRNKAVSGPGGDK